MILLPQTESHIHNPDTNSLPHPNQSDLKVPPKMPCNITTTVNELTECNEFVSMIIQCNPIRPTYLKYMIFVLMPHYSSVECKCIILFSERCNLWHPDRWAETERLHSCHGDQRHILSHQHHCKDYCSCQAMTVNFALLVPTWHSWWNDRQIRHKIIYRWLLFINVSSNESELQRCQRLSKRDREYFSCRRLRTESIQDWCIKINFDLFNCFKVCTFSWKQLTKMP